MPTEYQSLQMTALAMKRTWWNAVFGVRTVSRNINDIKTRTDESTVRYRSIFWIPRIRWTSEDICRPSTVSQKLSVLLFSESGLPSLLCWASDTDTHLHGGGELYVRSICGFSTQTRNTNCAAWAMMEMNSTL